MDLCSQVLAMTTGEDASVRVIHEATSFTRLANGVAQTSNDGDRLYIELGVQFAGGGASLYTDQLDRDTLQQLIRECELAMQEKGEADEVIVPDRNQQDEYVPVHLWHDSTIEAMHASRSTLLPEILDPIKQHGLVAAGYSGFSVKAIGEMKKVNKIQGFYEETDCELSVTARTKDGTGSGWGGQAARAWETIDPKAAVERAIWWAEKGANPQAMEPGRYTAILTREAVAQIMRYFAEFYDAAQTEDGLTPFFKQGYPANRINQKVFDAQIDMNSDPGDPDGGFAPFMYGAYGNPSMEWAKHGILKDLAFTQPSMAVPRHRKYSQDALSLRISGGDTTIEQMIARCQKGIYVNHLAGVELLDQKTGVMTGTTRDGCLLVKDGKIDRPLKNFRFIDSPIFMLNNLLAIGESKRVAYGYTPRGRKEWAYGDDWPRLPMIVPPMMIRDFNFTSLSDAV